MFGILTALTRKKNHVVVEAPTPQKPFSDEKVDAVMSILVDAKMIHPEMDREFRGAAQSEYAYSGGVMEWTDRSRGIRLLATKPFHSETVTAVRVVKHGYTSKTEEEFAEVNVHFEQLFANN